MGCASSAPRCESESTRKDEHVNGGGSGASPTQDGGSSVESQRAEEEAGGAGGAEGPSEARQSVPLPQQGEGEQPRYQLKVDADSDEEDDARAAARAAKSPGGHLDVMPSANVVGIAPKRMVTLNAPLFAERAPSLQRAATSGDWVLHHRTDDIYSKYSLGRQLGEPGAFGVARLATNVETEERFAVKVVSKPQARSAMGRERMEAFRREVTILMEQESHPHLLDFVECFETAEELYIVTELCSGGELYDKIASGVKFTEAEASRVIGQVLSGIKALHDKNIAHCDIKPSNILFKDKSPDAAAKIIDFGMSRLWSPREREYFTSVAGTCYYQSPEMIDRKFRLSCDLWSVGIITFILLYGYAPFSGRSNASIRRRIKRGFTPELKDTPGPHFYSQRPVSEEARDFIAHLLRSDPADRYTVDEALAHSWISGPPADIELSPLVLQSLRKFSAFTRFQHHVLNLMVEHISPDEIRKLRRAFDAMDKDHDHRLTVEEMKEALTGAKFSDEERMEENEVEQLFELADENKDGHIDFDELLKAVAQLKLVSMEERLHRAFNAFDLDEDEFITPEEIAATLSISVEEAREYVKHMDTDGNGQIDYDEFLALWRQEADEACKF